MLETAGRNYDLILVQEPYIDFNAVTRANTHYTTVYPLRHRDVHPGTLTRAVILVNKRLNTNNWAAIPIDCPDLTAVELKTDTGIIRIFNIYNSCLHNDTLDVLKRYMDAPGNRPRDGERIHYIWARDFNRHHPLWDEPCNCHLFTNHNLEMTEPLLALIARHHMKMALPEGMPTLRAMSTGNFTRVDNVFLSDALLNTVIKCTARPEDLPPRTDHFPIETILDISAPLVEAIPRRNFRCVDWDDFNKALQTRLGRLPAPSKIRMVEEFRERVQRLDEAVDDTIAEKVPLTRPCPHSKRWWNQDLKKARKETRKFGWEAARYMHAPDHPSHREFQRKRNEYAQLLIDTKQKHWIEWLTNISSADMWTASRLVSGAIPEGGRTRVPTLVVKDPITGEQRSIADNAEKGKTFYETFFPPNPPPLRCHLTHSTRPQHGTLSTLTRDRFTGP
jgi:hypothetical protein